MLTHLMSWGARRWVLLGMVPLAAMALALRLRMMLVGRSLWLDESALALNICGRSFSELLGPLDHDQAAPIGFLWIERLSVLAFGPTEAALRIFPFACSIVSLILIYRFCARNLDQTTAVASTAMAGVLPALVYYSGELKQYSSDVTAGLLILVMTADAMRRGFSTGRAVGMAIAGMGLVWISHPSVFFLAGAGTTLLVQAAVQRRPRAMAIAATVSACWLASFAVEYLWFLKDLQVNKNLAEYWESAFLRFPPKSPKDLRVYSAIGFGVFETLFQNAQVDVDLSLRMGVFMAAAWMVGVVTLYRHGHRRMLMLLVMPLAFAVVASMLHKYPLKSRLSLFTAAATLPVVAVGIAGQLRSRDLTSRGIGVVLLSIALLLPTMQGTQFLLERPRLHDARSVLGQVASRWEPGDVVVVDRYSDLPFLYYRAFGRVAGLDRVAITRTELSLCEPEDLAREIARWEGRPRVWFLLDTALPDPTNGSRMALKVLLDLRGERLESASCRRYSAHLYSFDQTAAGRVALDGPRP